MKRDAVLTRAAGVSEVDLVVIGGGATGLGVAWDAATRGHSVLLVEGRDFGSGSLVDGRRGYLALAARGWR